MPIFGEIIHTKEPVLITFFADWHMHTEQMNSVLQEVAITMGDSAKVVKIDVDKNRELTKAFQINILPTSVLYVQGEVVWRTEGLKTAQNFITEIQKFTKLNG